MIIAYVTCADYSLDTDTAIYVVFIKENNKINVEHFNIKYSWEEEASDEEDEKDILNILKEKYGNNITIINKTHNINYHTINKK